MKIKKFVKEHKKEIIGTGVVIGVAAMASYLTKSYYTKNFRIVPRSLDMITWTTEQQITNEVAKELLDLNVENDSMYMIFKNGKKLSSVVLNKTNVIQPQI